MSDWSKPEDEVLAMFWNLGLSTGEIGKHFKRHYNRTRNAVIGRAHRLGLSGRPNPIKAPPVSIFRQPAHLTPERRLCEWPIVDTNLQDQKHKTLGECGEPLWKHTPYCEKHFAKSVRRTVVPDEPGYIPYRKGKK